MALLATGSITFTEQFDEVYALLSSDTGLVPVDNAGTPKTPLSTTPLSTTMSVYKANVLQTGWTFSRTQSNATSAINASTGVLTVTAVSTDSAYVDITATKSGEPSLTKRYSIAKVYQGDPGQTGPTGPVGISGQLGLNTSGSTLILGSFSSSGAFQAASGIMCVSGSEGMTVPTYSLALTGSGMGYALYNPAWASPRFAKMSAQSSGTAHWIEWKDYNTAVVIDIAGNTYVFGSFKYINAMFSEMKIFTGYEPEDFCKSHLIELLAKEDISDATDWAQALGAQQVFKRLAAVEMLAASLVVQNAKSPNYAEDASGTPTNGFCLDGPTDSMKSKNAIMKDITAEGGQFAGKVKHPAFETFVAGQAGAEVTLGAKSRWNSNDLYTALVGLSTSVLSAVSGTSGGNTLVSGVRLPSTSQSVVCFDKTINSSVTIDYSFTIPVAGTYYVRNFGCTSYYDNDTETVRQPADLYKNGVLLESLPKHSGGSEGDWLISLPTFTVSCAKGDIIRCVLYGVGSDLGSGQTPNSLGRCTLTWTPGVTGLFLIDSNNNVILYPLGNYYFSTAVSVTAPNIWSSASNLNYAPGAAFVDGVSTYSEGAIYTASGTVTINGTARTVVGVSKSGSYCVVYWADGSYVFASDSTEGTSVGWHNASGSWAATTELARIETLHIGPKVDATSATDPNGSDLGSGTKRFRNLALAGNVTSNGGAISGFSQVYGAVFN